MRFEFCTAGRILFGPGVLKRVGPFAAETGRRVFVVTGGNVERAELLLQDLKRHGLDSACFSVVGEPTLDALQEGLVSIRRYDPDLVIGFGGGSVIDAGKAIAALATNRADVRDYLEVIGRAQPLTRPPLPYVAVPTTAGTGAEVTCNAVIKSTRDQVKVSLRSPLMLPRLAVVDPQLTVSMPPAVTAGTGMDAATQLWEAFVSKRANPMTDALCREGLRRVANALQRAYRHPDEPASRQDMSLASLFSGMALANAGLGAVHGIAGPLGGMCSAPHGLACARLLPLVAAANLKALMERDPDSPSLPKFREAAQVLTQSADARAEDGIHWLKRLGEEFRIPSLSECGLQEKQIPRLVSQALLASSMKANPVLLTAGEVERIIRSAF
jgi:alcohol dehydrogenase class IV